MRVSQREEIKQKNFQRNIQENDVELKKSF